jgi:transcriptional regulator with PAS, ATPase and Fis domain
VNNCQEFVSQENEMNTSVSLITQNSQMRSIISMLGQITESDGTVLLIGETGVGKEIFAEYIHQTSNRCLKPFFKIGLSALPVELMESELFGHEKGSFTGAMNLKKGLFELASTGSLFLDDIDDVPLNIQSKLLRVLESHEFMRIGGTVSIPVDVRLIAASKVNLKELVDKGLFRRDLYYRINVIPVEIPALRDRKDDIIILAEHFIKRFSPEKKINISKEAHDLLLKYPWPGNIRELRNIIQRTVIFCNGEINAEHLPLEINNQNERPSIINSCLNCWIEKGMNYNQIVQCLEKNLIHEALEHASGNQSEAARILGLSLSTFRDKMKKSSPGSQSNGKACCENP